MKTTAVRLYGKDDLRLETFELPKIKDDEILARVISDSICMSSYKATKQGAEHKRVPDNVAENPVIIGHEFCGQIIEVGAKWQDKFKPGEHFSIQPAFNYKGSLDAPGYSYQYIGGAATYIVIPNEAMEMDCLLEYKSDVYFYGSLSEPVSCIVGAFHASYHSKQGSYEHHMGIKKGGRMAILAGVGPMGLGAIDYAIHNERRPSLLVVTISTIRGLNGRHRYTQKKKRRKAVWSCIMSTQRIRQPKRKLMAMTDGEGFDDVFVMAPVKPVVEQADRLLGKDGCMNFFAGPTNPEFSASFNFYNVHYAATHVVGTSGGNNDDMRESIQLMSGGVVTPAAMVTHVGGLNAVIETTRNLPNIPGGKKLIYTHLDMPLTAIDDFEEKGKSDPFFKDLSDIVKRNGGFWCGEAEQYVLNNAKKIDE